MLGQRPPDRCERKRDVLARGGHTLTDRSDIVDHLRDLAERELAPVLRTFDDLNGRQIASLLIEAIRAVNILEVRVHLTPETAVKPAAQDYDILIRGWNLLFGHLLQRLAVIEGIPGLPSTVETQTNILAMLHSCGRSHVLAHAADMLRFGILDGQHLNGVTTLQLSDQVELDYFSAELNEVRLVERMKDVRSFRDAPSLSTASARERMKSLVFPWPIGDQVLVGYNTDPDIDELFIDSVVDVAMRWRDSAGLHASADLDGCTGQDLADAVALIMSMQLKHIMFVDAASQSFDINYTMALTIWNHGDELAETLAAVMGAPLPVARRAVDLITVKPSDWPLYLDEGSPQLPHLVEISPGYRVRLPAANFRNPFTGIRMRHERSSDAATDAVRRHREQWMASDLYSLFQGTRYQCVDGQVLLRRNKAIVTDIDAAILDVTTGELAIFQLKWQDFATSAVQSQVSKARNYNREVDQWARKVDLWARQFGGAALCRNLRFKTPPGFQPTAIHLFAIGRTRGRFRSYGFQTESKLVASASCAEFVNLRFEIGPASSVLGALHSAILAPDSGNVHLIAHSHTLTSFGETVVFNNIWNSLDHDPHAPIS